MVFDVCRSAVSANGSVEVESYTYSTLLQLAEINHLTSFDTVTNKWDF